MIRVSFHQRITDEVFESQTISKAISAVKGMETDEFKTGVWPPNDSHGFIAFVHSAEATLAMGLDYARDIVLRVQKAGVPLVISQVRFQRELEDPS